jgi:uncharacterized protein with von Willebrand factor type A (vWA) domain
MESYQSQFIQWSERRTSLTEFLIGFCRSLRSLGYPIGPNEMMDVLNGVVFLGASRSYVDLKSAVKATLVRTPSQSAQFDQIFDSYWNETHRAQDSKVKEQQTNKRETNKQSGDQSIDALKSWLYGKQEEEEIEVALYSQEATLSKKNFTDISETEVNELMEIMRMLGRKLALQINRRKENALKGRISLSKLIRKNFKTGGELMHLFFEQPKKSKNRIVLICDVSRSMEMYSRFLIHFAYSFQKAFKSVETFVFSTSLHRVSQALRNTHATRALDALAESAPGWGGGTRIGECLEEFVEKYAKRYVQSNTIIMIMSDGWDTGDSESTRHAMQKMSTRAAQIIWMNPLMGQPGYEAKTSTLIAAAPYIDIMLPVHHAASLKQLLRVL